MNKGYAFEIELVDELRKFLSTLLGKNVDDIVYRIEGSGRSKNATKTGNQSVLEGDVMANLKATKAFPFSFLIEAKHHKSHTVEKSVSVKKEWVDQAYHEAIKNGAVPVVAIKFKGVKPNSKELQQYEWADGSFGNSVHYIIPEPEFLKILEALYTDQVNSSMRLAEFSTAELIEELTKRVK